MTMLTSDTALSDTPTRLMVPTMSTTVISTVRVTVNAVANEPKRIVVRTRMNTSATPTRVVESCTIDAYWSKKM